MNNTTTTTERNVAKMKEKGEVKLIQPDFETPEFDEWGTPSTIWVELKAYEESEGELLFTDSDAICHIIHRYTQAYLDWLEENNVEATDFEATNYCPFNDWNDEIDFDSVVAIILDDTGERVFPDGFEIIEYGEYKGLPTITIKFN